MVVIQSVIHDANHHIRALVGLPGPCEIRILTGQSTAGLTGVLQVPLITEFRVIGGPARFMLTLNFWTSNLDSVGIHPATDLGWRRIDQPCIGDIRGFLA